MKNHVMEIHVRRGLTVLILSLNGKNFGPWKSPRLVARSLPVFADLRPIIILKIYTVQVSLTEKIEFRKRKLFSLLFELKRKLQLCVFFSRNQF